MSHALSAARRTVDYVKALERENRRLRKALAQAKEHKMSEQSGWQPNVAMAIQACRDENLPDGACRFAVLACLVEPQALTEADIRFGQELWAEMQAERPTESTPIHLAGLSVPELQRLAHLTHTRGERGHTEEVHFETCRHPDCVALKAALDKQS